MNSRGWVGLVVLVIIIGGAVYFLQRSPSNVPEGSGDMMQTSSSTPENTTTGTTSVQGGSNVDSVANDISANANAEAASANAENGTQDAAQINSQLDSQTNNVQ